MFAPRQVRLDGYGQRHPSYDVVARDIEEPHFSYRHRERRRGTWARNRSLRFGVQVSMRGSAIQSSRHCRAHKDRNPLLTMRRSGQPMNQSSQRGEP